MRRGSITGRATDGRRAAGSWRDDALRTLLSLGSIVAPLASVLTIVFRPPPRPVLDTIVILAAGLVMPVLRFTPGVPFRVRAGVTMGALFSAGVFVLARTGLAPGVTLLFAVSSIFGAIYFGRRVGLSLMGAGALAFIVVGWFVTRGHLRFPPDLFDPHLFRNWFRVGAIYALIGSLLTTGVSFVIARVEAGARDLRVAYERLGQLHLRLESTKEEERRFLAHELHDEMGQSLTALKLSLQLAARGLPPPGTSGPIPTDPLSLIDGLIARVRRMSGDLRPPLLDEVGLVPALRALLEAQAAVSGVAMTLVADETPDAPRPGPSVEIACFRIVQEAVTNALRHADPRDLRVQLGLRADRIELRIHDDGRGFDVGVRLDGAAAEGHLGVVGMRERVRAHGGGFQLKSRPGAGTTIEVVLPLGPAGLGAAVAVPS